MSYGILYIGSIPVNFTESEVLSYFQQYSPLVKFTMITTPTRAAIASHFGYLMAPTEIVGVICSYHHYFGDKKIVCQEHLSEQDSLELSSSLQRRRIFVRNVKKTISDEDLRRTFSRYGSLESAFIIKDQLTGKCRSFGYVTFDDEKPAAALIAKGQVSIKGVKIFIHPFEKNLDSTLEFLKKKADENLQSDSPYRFNTATQFSPSVQESSSICQTVSTKRVQTHSVTLKHFSPSRPGQRKRPSQNHLLFSDECTFNIRGSESRAAAFNRGLSSETQQSNYSPNASVFLSRQQPLTACPDSRCRSEQEIAHLLSVHVKPTSSLYKHSFRAETEGSHNLRFNRLLTATKNHRSLHLLQ